MNLFKMDFLNYIFIVFAVYSANHIAYAEHLPLKADSSIEAQRSTLPEYSNTLFSLFNPMYVVKGYSTDCSFVSAFMLMTNKDPDYPYKILKYEKGQYSVKYPGLKEEIKISNNELEKFYKTIEVNQRGANIKQEAYTPKGMEILRAAYYKYQRKKGLRPPQYKVYGGGNPIQDLMVLSGIKQGGKIMAVQNHDQTSINQTSFANGIEQKIKVELQDGVFIYKHDGFSDENLNPFSIFGEDISSYLISVSSIREIGFFANLFGKRIVDNHAYYFLGVDQEGDYILGDSYNTKEPVHIGRNEFLEKFNAIYYVKIPSE